MLGFALAVLASSAAADAGSDTDRLSGRCRYNDALRDHLESSVLAMCDTFEISRGGGGATFDFSRRDWGSTMQFHGEIDGDRMEVDRVTLRSGSSVEVTGTCEIFYTNNAVSVVSCLANKGAQSYVANFVPLRF